MSRKTKRNKPAESARPQPSPKATGRMMLFGAAMVGMLLLFAIAAQIYMKGRSSGESSERNLAVAAAEHAPTLGPKSAKVHIVEFLDPACESCKAFYPHVKKIVAANPDRIRVSVRHVAFHPNADQVVRMLEAARSQGKYWQALEAVFDSQDTWTINHRAIPDKALPALKAAGLDIERIRAEMNLPEITRRIEKDAEDARRLGVEKTPTFFVNGKPLPRFGLKELQSLVAESLRSAYGL